MQRRHGLGAHRAPGGGDDAVGAEVFAPVLDLYKGPGAPAELPHRGDGLEALPRLVGADIHHPLPGGEEPVQSLGKPPAVPAAGDHVRFLHGLGCLREGLGKAAGEADGRPGVFPPQPPQQLPGLAVPFGGDGAGVHHHGVPAPLVVELQHLPSLGGELLAQGLGLVLVHLTAEGIKGDLHSGAPYFDKMMAGRMPSRSSVSWATASM